MGVQNHILKTEEVAKWFIYNNPDLANGYLDANVRLNKLLYFASVMYYCVTSETLLDENFVAFPKGPVIYDVYKRYRYNGLNKIPENDVVNGMSKKQLQVLEITNFIYGSKDARELTAETHRHSAWKDVESQIPHNPRVDISKAKEFSTYYRAIFETYKDYNFKRLRKEIIYGNVFYFDCSLQLTDENIMELAQYPKFDTPHFIESVDGMLVLS